VKRQDLIRHLARNGCVLAREGSDHFFGENPANGRRTAVPRHREILNTNTRAIRRPLRATNP